MYCEILGRPSKSLSSNLYFSVRNSIEISYKQFFMITGGLNDEEQE